MVILKFKVCIKGSCTMSSAVPDSQCLFSEDVFNSNLVEFDLPSPNMNCQTFLDYVLNVRNESPYAYCSSVVMKNACCNTCQSKFF